MTVVRSVPKEGSTIRAAVLIRVDWIAGAAVGAAMLSLRGPLAGLYGLPEGLLLAMGIANAGYAGVSFTLDRLRQGDRVPLLRVVAAANMAWAVGCLITAVAVAEAASVFGMGQLLGEAVFVGGLGMLEWRAGGGNTDEGG